MTTDEPNENGKREAGDELLVLALGSGQSYAAAAKTAHFSKSTVARRMAEPEFRARVVEERESHLDAARRTLAAAAPEAIGVLLDLARGAASDSVRLGDGINKNIGKADYDAARIEDVWTQLIGLAANSARSYRSSWSPTTFPTAHDSSSS
jgi:hypothetical protein